MSSINKLMELIELQQSAAENRAEIIAQYQEKCEIYDKLVDVLKGEVSKFKAIANKQQALIASLKAIKTSNPA